MNTENRIRTLEKTYRGRLECFFNSVYPAGKFVSHGIDHHRRVWNFAKELINCTYKENPDTGIFKKLMIACFLHDIGMSVNPGIKHGYQSRKICEEFLNVNHLPISKFNDVLQAIEVHDEKEYHFNDRNENYILKILSAADDLDAFGYIGVFRYTEIYLFRGTDPADLGHVILSNASNRIRYFSSKFAMYPDLVSKHRKRFEMLYYAGGFQGGKTEEFIKAMKVMRANIEKDFNKNYIARWNDESHWNKYLFDNPPSLVLSPAYVYPDSLIADYYVKVWGRNYSPKIVTLTKKFTITKEGADATKQLTATM